MCWLTSISHHTHFSFYTSQKTFTTFLHTMMMLANLSSHIVLAVFMSVLLQSFFFISRASTNKVKVNKPLQMISIEQFIGQKKEKPTLNRSVQIATAAAGTKPRINCNNNNRKSDRKPPSMLLLFISRFCWLGFLFCEPVAFVAIVKLTPFLGL